MKQDDWEIMLPLLPPIVPGNEASYCNRSHLNGEQRVGSRTGRHKDEVHILTDALSFDLNTTLALIPAWY